MTKFCKHTVNYSCSVCNNKLCTFYKEVKGIKYEFINTNNINSNCQ